MLTVRGSPPGADRRIGSQAICHSEKLPMPAITAFLRDTRPLIPHGFSKYDCLPSRATCDKMALLARGRARSHPWPRACEPSLVTYRGTDCGPTPLRHPSGVRIAGRSGTDSGSTTAPPLDGGTDCGCLAVQIAGRGGPIPSIEVRIAGRRGTLCGSRGRFLPPGPNLFPLPACQNPQSVPYCEAGSSSRVSCFRDGATRDR